MAKAIGLFVQAVDTCHEGLEDEEDDVSEQEEKPFEILQIGGPNTSSEDANSIFSTSHSSASKSEKQSITTRQQRLQQQKEQQSSVDSEPGSSSPLKHTANTRIQNALKGLVSDGAQWEHRDTQAQMCLPAACLPVLHSFSFSG